MSASAFRYQPALERNGDLRGRIIALAQHHRCYGSLMIYLRLCQSGLHVNHRRVERLYAADREAVGASTQAEEGAGLGASASGTTAIGQSGLVDGLRI